MINSNAVVFSSANKKMYYIEVNTTLCQELKKSAMRVSFLTCCGIVVSQQITAYLWVFFFFLMTDSSLVEDPRTWC